MCCCGFEVICRDPIILQKREGVLHILNFELLCLGMIEMIEDLAGAAAPLVFDSQEHSHDKEQQQQQAYVFKTSKRRKCSAETRVISVPDGDAAAADTWAWRKYGQKPIKGSPYPRSYYRCSSSKGCFARKQVERSKNNPSMLVVTYTCDHNHPQPHPNNTKKHHNHAHNHSNHHHHQQQHQHQEEEASEVAETALTTNSNTPAAAAEMSPAPVMDAPVLPPSPPSTSSPTLLFTQHDDVMCTTNIDIDVGDDDLFADLDELPEWSAFFLRTSAGMAAAAIGASDERTQQKQQQSCSVSSPSSSSMELPLHPFPLLDE